MHSTFSQTQPTGIQQQGILGKLQGFWYRGKSPRWQPENFTVSNEVLNNKDTLINQAEQVFYQYDRNRTGTLEKTEFKKAVQALGYDKIKSKMVGRLVDKDQNGKIGIEEFVNVFLYLRSGGQIQNIPGKKGFGTSGISGQGIGTTGLSGQQGFGSTGVGQTGQQQYGYGQQGFGQQQPLQPGVGQTGLSGQGIGTTGLSGQQGVGQTWSGQQSNIPSSQQQQQQQPPYQGTYRK